LLRAREFAGRVKLHDRWLVRIAILVAVALYMRLPPRLEFGPWWVVPVIVGCLLIPLIALSASARLTRLTRTLSIVLIATLNVVNIASAVLLLVDLLDPHAKYHAITALELLRSGGLVWATNVIVFALWFWELDADGPFARERAQRASEFRDPDFLFPQMQVDLKRVAVDPNWKPGFVDYLYVSFTNALAVSPTDTMPLTHWAKMLMLVQSLISFTTVALILARSVNILN
jgi:uncharacterized membrane protein